MRHVVLALAWVFLLPPAASATWSVVAVDRSTSRVVIGNDCLIGDSVAIYDADFHNLSPERRRDQQFPTAPIILGNNIWIGSRAMILKGVTVGDHSVIGAMSIVTKSIPPRTLVAGNPARIVRELA